MPVAILFFTAACLFGAARVVVLRAFIRRSDRAPILLLLFFQSAVAAFLFAGRIVNGSRIDLGYRVDSLTFLLPLRALCVCASVASLRRIRIRPSILLPGAAAVGSASLVPQFVFGPRSFELRAESILFVWSALSAVAFVSLSFGFGSAFLRNRGPRFRMLTAAAAVAILADFLPFYGRQPLAGFPLALVGLIFLDPALLRSPFFSSRPSAEKDCRLRALLSARELEVARFAARGSSNKEIAESLFISLSTVKKHLYNAMEKIDVRNRVELAGIVFAEDEINPSSTVSERPADASSDQGESSMTHLASLLPESFGGRKGIRVMYAAAVFIAIAAFASCAHSAVRRGLAAEPDGINVFPSGSIPGSYLVNPRFSRISEVSVVKNSVPDIDGPPPESRILPASAWSYDRIHSQLVLRDPIDDLLYWVMVRGRFDYPLVFFPDRKVESGSVRVIVDGAIGLEGTDYRCGADPDRIELIRTTGETEWFALTYRTEAGQCSIGSMEPDRLTRAMAAHLGCPLDGNCRLAEDREEGAPARRFIWEQDPVSSAPWMVHLLPKGEGYVGVVLWPRDFTYDAETRMIVLKQPIDPDRFGVYALDEAK